MSGNPLFAIEGGHGWLPTSLPPYAADAEGPELRARTSTCVAVSIGVHTLLLAWLIMAPKAAASRPPLTEITMIEPGELDAAAAPAAPSAAPMRSAGVMATSDADEHFRRELPRATVAPTPQDNGALDDRLNARLAAMQRDATIPSAGIVPSASTSTWGTSPATIAGPSSSGQGTIALTRGGGTGSAPLALSRGTGGPAPAPALAPAGEQPGTSQAPAQSGDATARRTLAGATLMGPIADRAILSRVTPVYPDWAKRDVVEGSVTLYFVVRADGTVKENVLVQKTAGFEEFDENARTAIRAWRFEPLSGGRTGEQWGTITFHFRLRDGG
jgi:TonB family protein